MTDLIERLRDPLECPTVNSVFELCREAADRIEQLEAALEDIVAADHCEGGEYCPHCIARNTLAEERE